MDDLPRRDLAQLSDYVDGNLSARQVAALERRLEDDPILRRALEEMQETVHLLRGLPVLDPPRSYALSAEMAGLRQPPQAYPILRLATALAALAFFVVVGVDAISGMALGAARESSQMAPAAEEIMRMQDVTEDAPAAAEEEQEASKSVEMPAPSMAVGEAQVEAEAEEAIPRPSPTPCEPCSDTFAEEAPSEERAPGAAPEESLEEQPEAEGAPTDALQATARPSSTPADFEEPAPPTPAPTPTAEIRAAERQPGFWTSLRIVEAGLAGLSLLLAGLTIYFRKRG
jgi:hypothetical protein